MRSSSGRIAGGVLIALAMGLILRAAGAFQLQGNGNIAQNQIEADRPPIPDPNATRSPTSTTQTPDSGTQTFAPPNTNPPGSSTSTNPSALPEGAVPDTTTGTTGTGTTGTGTTGTGTSSTGTTTDTTANQTPYPPAVRAGW